MNKEQFIELVGSEQEQLRRFLLALCCGNRDEADDIAQDSLIKAYLSIGRYREHGKFSAWLYRIAYNTFLDYRRCRTDSDSIDRAGSLPSDSMESDREFRYEELYAAIGMLSEKERTAILLFYMKGYSVREISRIVDCSEDAVKKQLSRGREQLKSILS